MKILGIETSCDETAISLIDVDENSNSITILGNRVHSQVDTHIPHGGVFPMLAKREHAKNLVPVLKSVLEEAEMLTTNTVVTAHKNEIEKILERDPELLESFKYFIPKIKKPDIDFISVTVGPGLEPALWVGITFAQALSKIWDIPLIPCNHMEGHILIGLIEEIHSNAGKKYDLLNKRIMYPAISLLISGGHTQIVLIEKSIDKDGEQKNGQKNSYKIIGDTRDDAVGECFDKVARMLGLAYPGGPKISALAEEARQATNAKPDGIPSPLTLPRPMISSKDFDFSFSGLKTAVLYAVKEAKEKNRFSEDFIKGISREVEDAITDVLIKKMRKAIEHYAIETLIIGGGVVANKNIRKAMEKLADECSIKILLPQTNHATDNGLMIALAGYFNIDKAVGTDHTDNDIFNAFKAKGTLPLGPRA